MAHLRWVDEHALVKSCPRLYHYTRIDRLKLILESEALVATPIADTNDRQEARALRDAISNVMYRAGVEQLRGVFEKIGVEFTGTNEEFLEICKRDAETCHDAVVNSCPSPPRLTCFSAHDLSHHQENGLLSMWRSYGGGGDCIALGFDTEELRTITEQVLAERAVDWIYLQRVGYGPSDPAVAQRLEEFDALPNIFLRGVAAVIAKEKERFVDHGEDLFHFLELALSTKHPDFEDEREVRLVTLESVDGAESDRERLDRTGDGRLLIRCLSALREIIVGPSSNQDRGMNAASKQLKIHGRADVEVRASATPFRLV